MNAFIILKIAGSSLSLTYYLTKHNNNKHDKWNQNNTVKPHNIPAVCRNEAGHTIEHTEYGSNYMLVIIVFSKIIR